MTVGPYVRVGGLRYCPKYVLTLPGLLSILTVAEHLFLDYARVDWIMVSGPPNLHIVYLVLVLGIKLLHAS